MPRAVSAEPERIVVQTKGRPDVERALERFRRREEKRLGHRVTRSDAVRNAIIAAADTI